LAAALAAWTREEIGPPPAAEMPKHCPRVARGLGNELGSRSTLRLDTSLSKTVEIRRSASVATQRKKPFGWLTWHRGLAAGAALLVTLLGLWFARPLTTGSESNKEGDVLNSAPDGRDVASSKEKPSEDKRHLTKDRPDDPQPDPRVSRPGFDIHGDPLPAMAVARIGRLVPIVSGNIVKQRFTKDGKKLFAVVSPHTVVVFEVPSRKILARADNVAVAPSYNNGFAISPDGSWAAWIDQRSGAWLWKGDGTAPPRKIDPPQVDQVLALEFSANGKELLLGGSKGHVCHWLVAHDRGRARSFPAHSNRIIAVAFAQDGKEFYTVSEDLFIRTWDAATHAKTKEFHAGTLQALTAKFSQNGTACVYTTAEAATYNVCLYNTTSGQVKVIESLPKQSLPWPFISGDGGLLACTLPGTPQLPTTLNRVSDPGKPALPKIHLNNLYPLAMALNDDGSLAALSISTMPGYPVWLDVPSGKEVHPIDFFLVQTFDATFDRNDRRIATASQDHQLRIWDVNGKLLATTAYAFTGNARVAFLRDGSVLANRTSSGVVAFSRDLTTEHAVVPPGQDVWFAVSPDETRMVTWSSSTSATKLWNLTPPGELAQLPARPGRASSIRSVAWSPSGKRLAASYADGYLGIWNLETTKLLGEFKTGIAITLQFLDEDRLVATSTNSVVAIDIRKPDAIEQVGDFPSRNTAVSCLATSPDRRILAAGDAAGRLVLVNLATNSEIRAVPTGQGALRKLSFSHDGTRLLSVGNQREILIWDVKQLVKPEAAK
jgi:WD40 repeat protein